MGRKSREKQQRRAVPNRPPVDHLPERALSLMLSKLASNSQLVPALWLLVAYLLVLYAALRWGTGSSVRYPGSD